MDLRLALNSLSGDFIGQKRKEFGDGHTEEYVNEEKTGVKLSQSKECQELLEAGRDEKTFFSKSSKRIWLCSYLHLMYVQISYI